MQKSRMQATQYQKHAEFYADFKFIDAGFLKCPQQKLKAKNHEKMHKNEKTQNSHSFLQKVKSYFFANIYQSPCDSYGNSKKSIKFKPPNGGVPIRPG
jgi:hypothetical protein